jgi:hypothetical protein
MLADVSNNLNGSARGVLFSPEQCGSSMSISLLLGAVAVALCCGAPPFVGAVVATGVGASPAAVGSAVFGLAVTALGVVAFFWRAIHARRACDLAGEKRTAASKGIR